jgi:hypothetical protein
VTNSTSDRRNKKKRTTHFVVVFAVLVLAGTAKLQATTIEIDLGPPAVYTGTNAQVGPIAFSDLNGLPVNGSSVSLDFFFTKNEFVRLFSNTAPLFDIGVALLTNAGTYPGFVTNAAAYLIDQSGNAIPGFSVVGRADGSNGVTGLGFFPLLVDANGTPNPNLTFPLDFYGVHFSFTLPNDPSVSVIGADFTLFGNGGQFSQFAVGPHVPDSGSTWLLLLIGISGLVAGPKSKPLRHWPCRILIDEPQMHRRLGRPDRTALERTRIALEGQLF